VTDRQTTDVVLVGLSSGKRVNSLVNRWRHLICHSQIPFHWPPIPTNAGSATSRSRLAGPRGRHLLQRWRNDRRFL